MHINEVGHAALILGTALMTLTLAVWGIRLLVRVLGNQYGRDGTFTVTSILKLIY